MKGLLLVVVVILASTVVESEEVKEVQYPNTSSLLEWRIREALKKNNTMTHPKIIGGNVASYDQFKYQVLLELYGALVSVFLFVGWCGGSIIADTWVLTAAHCLKRDFKTSEDAFFPTNFPYQVGAVSVGAGGASTNYFRQIRWVPLSHFVIHTNYDSATRYNDLALLKTDPWDFRDPFVQPIKLPDKADADNINVYVGRTAVASGYGPTENTETGTPSSRLRYITLQGISREQCLLQYDNKIPASAFCAESREDGKGSICSYDAGGPLTLLINNVPTLIGVASFTHPTRGCDGTPQGFQMVAAEIDWIEETME